MEEEKKEKSKINTLVIIIVIMALIILGLGGYLVYKEFFEKNDKVKEPIEVVEPTNSPKPTEEPENQISKVETEVRNNINNLDYILNYFNSYSTYPLNVDNLSNQFILNSALYKIGSLTETISKEQIEEAIAYIYGSDINYTHEDIECFLNDGNPLYKYDGAKYNYVDGHGHGGEGYYISKSYFIDATIDAEKGTIDVREKVLYGNYCDDLCSPIGSFYSAAGSNKVLYESEEPNAFDEAYEKVKNQLPITTYHFKKDSKGNYRLVSITVD